LEKSGNIVINPFEVCSNQNLSYEEYLRFDIRALTFCDAIYLLKDWGKSKGANIEYLVAMNIGLKVLYEE
jgi:hypothetical protein